MCIDSHVLLCLHEYNLKYFTLTFDKPKHILQGIRVEEVYGVNFFLFIEGNCGETTRKYK